MKGKIFNNSFLVFKNITMESYKEWHLSEKTAKEYDKAVGHKFDNRIYAVEDIVFLEYLKKYAKKDSKILDFACWTGRKTSFLKKHYDNVIWFDISDAMLSVAKEKYPNIDFRKVDLWKDNIKEKFDVITAFRFFLNAELSLKKSILNNMKNILNKEWTIIFNIHYNTYSIAYLVQKIWYFIWTTTRNQNGVSYWEMKRIVKECWYEIVESKWYSYLLWCSFLRWLPFKFLKVIDLFLMKLWIFKYFSKDIMFVIKLR